MRPDLRRKVHYFALLVVAKTEIPTAILKAKTSILIKQASIF